MWSADLRARTGQRGYTILESVIVTAMVATAALVIQGAVSSTRQADDYIGATWKATERGQRIAFEVASLVGSSRKLFQGDDVGLPYLQALELGPLSIAPGARLPVISDDAPLDDDDAFEPETGNILLFVRESDPAPAVADPALIKVRHIDTYRFVCIYPHETTRTLVATSGRAWDLVVWKSMAFPSFSQINEIQDATQRRNVLKDLYVRHGYRYLWNPDEPVGAAFYAFDAAGNLDGTPKNPMTIPEDRDVSDRGRLVYANLQLAPSSEDNFVQRVVLGADDIDTWSPHGFEVKVTGAVRSKQVWIHLVVETPQAGSIAHVHYGSTVIANCQDL